MATYEKKLLSQSLYGSGVWLGDEGLAINVHTTGSSTTVIDEMWLYVSNTGNTIANFSLYIGDFVLVGIFDVAAYSNLILVSPGLPVTGSGSVGTQILAQDNDSTGNVYIYGFVNRITP